MGRAISITSSTDLSPKPLPPDIRPVVKGKFIYIGDEKLYIRGVTYGAFRPDKNGNEYHNLEVIERDFAQTAANKVKSVDNTNRVGLPTQARKMQIAIRNLWEWWKRVAKKIGDFQARVILTIFYFIVLGPFALGVRLGSDPLAIKTNNPHGWHPKTDGKGTPIEQATKQF